jgi:hypothetical protein
VYLVISGSGTLASGPYRQYTALHLDEGEDAVFVAREETELLSLLLPDLTGIGSLHRSKDMVQAAE